MYILLSTAVLQVAPTYRTTALSKTKFRYDDSESAQGP